MNLATIVEGHEADRPALVSRGRTTTYGTLRDQVAQMRGALVARGIAPGDRVAILAANNWYFVSAYLAVLGAGAVAVPLNPQSPPAEIERELAATGVRLVLVGPAGRAAAEAVDVEALEGYDGCVDVPDLLAADPVPIVERAPDDLAVLLFTSGTAGAPRPAMLTHGNLSANLDQILANPARPDGVDEVSLAVLPLFHVFGLNAVLGLTLRVGGAVVLVERFDPHSTLAAVAEHGVTVLSGVPTMWAAWAALPDATPDDFAAVRYAVSGAAPLDPAVRRAVRDRFGLDLTEGYGLTEASPAVTAGLGHDAPDGSIGVPLPGVEVRLVDGEGEDALVGDPGELWVRGPNVFAGYWDDEDATAAALTPEGWLRTGDTAVVDDDGFLALVDRTKDVIIVSGFNVFPGEVEEVLAAHPAVEVAGVVGVPHPHSGEAVRAYVVVARRCPRRRGRARRPRLAPPGPLQVPDERGVRRRAARRPHRQAAAPRPPLRTSRPDGPITPPDAPRPTRPPPTPGARTMTDLHHRSAAELVALLAAGEVSSVELLDHFLARVERDGPALNAVVALDADRARARAAEADAARARGESWGPLHGLPMTIKDAFETEGLVTTSGAPELRDHVPEHDADAVARLRAAGAVIFGKTNLPLYAGDLETFNDVYGRTSNPWDLGRGVGGSSGGAAAALAAGQTGFELGSDIGGSIRNPAHYCGVFGLKPTWGIVSVRGHIPGPPGSLSQADVGVVGPMGRSAADLDLGLDVLAGPVGDDAVAWRLDLPPPRNRGRVEGLRVATWFDEPAPRLASDVRASLDGVAQALADAGAHVEAVPAPVPLDELMASWERLVLPLMTAGMAEEVFEGFAQAASLPVTEGEPREMRAVRAIALRHRDWAAADDLRQHHRRCFAELFERYDVLLAPVMPTAAPRHGEGQDIAGRMVDVDGEPRMAIEGLPWNGGIGTLLLPVAVPPIGCTPAGLPVGVQIVAPHLHDRTAVAVAAVVEQLLGGFVPPPELGGA